MRIASRYVLTGLLLTFLSTDAACQPKPAQDPPYRDRQQLALLLLSQMDTSQHSPLWPAIRAGALFRNLRENVLYPERVYQGHYTNFCAYAALTVLLARENPENYVRNVVELFTRGETSVNGKTIKPSASVRAVAGTLEGKGILNLNPADQLWFLAMADAYKAYLNLDQQFHPGDENKPWAICTIGKFNRMARELGGFRIESWGTDLFRPINKSTTNFIQEQLRKGIVVLYVNSNYLHPLKFHVLMMRAPTHYIIVHDIRETDGMVELTYWDYGLKTVQQLSDERLHDMIFGIIRMNLNE